MAWSAEGFDRPSVLTTAHGTAGEDPPRVVDRRPPKLSLKASSSSLRSAVRTGRLRLALGCDERCAVAATLLSRRDRNQRDLDDLAMVVTTRTAVARWTLDRRQRRSLARLLRLGGLRLTAHAVDNAGNRSYRYVRPAATSSEAARSR